MRSHAFKRRRNSSGDTWSGWLSIADRTGLAEGRRARAHTFSLDRVTCSMPHLFTEFKIDNGNSPKYLAHDCLEKLERLVALKEQRPRQLFLGD